MPNYQEQFAAIFEQAAQDKTFSFEAVKQINEMRTTFEKLAIEKAQVEKTLDSYIVGDERNRKRINILESENTALKALVKKAEDLDRKDFELKVKQEILASERNLAVDLFKTAFANVTVRREAMKSIGAANQQGGYMMTIQTPESETMKEE